MKIIIDDEDREIFKCVKRSVDHFDDDDFDEDEHDDELFTMLKAKRRLIRYTHYPGEDKILIDFPPKKRLGLF